jgi:hypothetical protein
MRKPQARWSQKQPLARQPDQCSDEEKNVKDSFHSAGIYISASLNAMLIPIGTEWCLILTLCLTSSRLTCGPFPMSCRVESRAQMDNQGLQPEFLSVGTPVCSVAIRHCSLSALTVVCPTCPSDGPARYLALFQAGPDLVLRTVAHLAYFHREIVVRRGWLSEEAYAELVGLGQFLTGPTSSQVGFAIGLTSGGWWGSMDGLHAAVGPCHAIARLLDRSHDRPLGVRVLTG